MQEVKPLVEWSMQGRCSTVLCYGQTGTGKTHTMNGMLTHVATALAGEHVEVVFFEVHAKKAFDLLCERKEVKLLADENERVHVRGAKTVDMPSLDSGTLMTVLEEGLKLRSVESGGRPPAPTARELPRPAAPRRARGSGPPLRPDLCHRPSNHPRSRRGLSLNKTFRKAR